MMVALLAKQCHHSISLFRTQRCPAAFHFLQTLAVTFIQLRLLAGRFNGFTFDEEVNDDDTTMEKNGVTLLIDPMSYQYLVGAEIDFTDGLEGSQFVIRNPNATSTCGCGSSFSV